MLCRSSQGRFSSVTLERTSRFFPNFVTNIPTHLKCHMWVNFPETEFLGTKPKIKRSRERNLSSSAYLLNKTSHKEISLFSRTGKAKKCTKSLLHVQSCCFADQTYCSFDVLVAFIVQLKLPFFLACSRRSETGEGAKQSVQPSISLQSPPPEPPGTS